VFRRKEDEAAPGGADLVARLDALRAAAAIPAASVRTAQTDAGEMLVHAHDEVISPMLEHEGTWEPDEAAWLRSVIRPGMTVVDVGANVGYFTLLCAKLTGPEGRVVSFEPEPENLRLLRANVWRNGADNVTVVPAAASDSRGHLALRLYSRENTGGHEVHAEAQEGDALVPSATIDEIVAGARVDVVKIDAQGADDAVVRGATRAIAANPAIRLLIEFWLPGMEQRGLSAEAIIDEYRAIGRPLALLTEGGVVKAATNEEILATTRGWEGEWVNLVLG
jgi:FkbM family methyltransferase